MADFRLSQRRLLHVSWDRRYWGWDFAYFDPGWWVWVGPLEVQLVALGR